MLSTTNIKCIIYFYNDTAVVNWDSKSRPLTQRAVDTTTNLGTECIIYHWCFAFSCKILFVLFPSTEMLPDENSNISMKSNVSSVSIRSPINYSVDTDRDPLNGSSSEERRFISDVMKSLKTEDSSKFVPIKSKQLNSTSESIIKFILNKKKNRTILNVENKNTSNEIILDSENAYDILKRTSRVNDSLYVHSVSPIQLHALKNESEGFDSMVEKLGALNSIKSFQSPPSKLLALLPSNGLDLTAIPSVPEVEITPIPSPGSEKLVSFINC